MLKLLETRAAALKSSKFDIAKEIEFKLTEEKDMNYDKVTRPNGFFCTFRHEIGYQKAIEIKNKIEFQGYKLKGIKRACEPSDLMWENKEVSPKARKWRTIFMIVFMILLAAVYFLFAVVAIQNQLFINYIVKPPGVDCSTLTNHHS